MKKKVLPKKYRENSTPSQRFRVAAMAPYFCVIDTSVPEQPFVWRVREDGSPAISTSLVRVFKLESEAEALADIINKIWKNSND